MRGTSRRRFIGVGILQTSLFGIGCGTVLHPERRGQPAGPLDWKIVALDAVGLILFFIPGVIAFAVDFNNGTIYLPPDRYGLKKRKKTPDRLVAVSVPGGKISVQKVEAIISQHASREISLTPGEFHTEKLADIDGFWPATDKLASL